MGGSWEQGGRWGVKLWCSRGTATRTIRKSKHDLYLLSLSLSLDNWRRQITSPESSLVPTEIQNDFSRRNEAVRASTVLPKPTPYRSCKSISVSRSRQTLPTHTHTHANASSDFLLSTASGDKERNPIRPPLLHQIKWLAISSSSYWLQWSE